MSGFIVALLFVRGQPYWHMAEDSGPIRLLRGPIAGPISEHSFMYNFIE